MRYWLFKTEPSAFSIESLKHAKNQTACWDGVRNYQARNFLKNDVHAGDGILFYHSKANPSGIVGEAVVVREGYPDHTAFDSSEPHYDPKSKPEKPIWYMVDVKFVRECSLIPLNRLKEIPGLSKMEVLRQGSRLSIQPVTAEEWKIIRQLPEFQKG